MGLLPFALPLGERIVPVLQDFTARYVVKLLQFSGVPVLLEGHVISIPEGGGKLPKRVVASTTWFLLLQSDMYSQALPTCPGRVASASLLHRPSAPCCKRVSRVHDHFDRVVRLQRHRRWSRTQPVRLARICTHDGSAVCHVRPMEGNAGQLRAALEIARIHRGSTPTWRVAAVAMIGLVVAASAPLSAALLWPGTQTDRSAVLKPWTVSSPWRIVQNGRYAWAPRFVMPSGESLQTYSSSEYVVKAYVAYYDPDRPGVKLVSGENALFDDPWWATGEGRGAVSIDGKSVAARETTLRSPQSSMLVLSWYWVDGTFTGNDYVAKLLLAKARLFHSQEGAAVIAVAAEDQGATEAAAILRDFLAHASVSSSLEAVRVNEP